MKDKAYRRAQDKRVIEKRLKLVKAMDTPHTYPDGKTYYEHIAETPNTLSKKHPFDCGKADCLMCHGQKIHKKWSGKKKIKYKDKDFKDGFEDIQ